MVPLIGGLGLGISHALGGQHPEWIVSYDAFKSNDSHYISYLRRGGWEGEYYTNIDENRDLSADVVGAVCPCAGLSSYSNTASVSNSTNDWMYKTAEYTCGVIKPRVFWGENAPRLSQAAGRGVADRLYGIGRKHGYSLNLYYTESRLHGNPQIRPRTFYFFTKDDTAPILPWFNKKPHDVSEILEKEIPADDPMNICANRQNPYDNPWIHYHLSKNKVTTLFELAKKYNKSNGLVKPAGDDTFDDVAVWMDINGHQKTGDRCRAISAKLKSGKGYWGHGVLMPVKDSIPSLIGCLLYDMINPYRDSFITIRDAMRFMGLPDDYNLAGENPIRHVNAIAQNVPVATAADMMSAIIQYLRGELQFASSAYIKQNNRNQTIKERVSDKSSVYEFF